MHLGDDAEQQPTVSDAAAPWRFVPGDRSEQLDKNAASFAPHDGRIAWARWVLVAALGGALRGRLDGGPPLR